MTKIKNWLQYWKNSLADAERAEIDFQGKLFADTGYIQPAFTKTSVMLPTTLPSRFGL